MAPAKKKQRLSDGTSAIIEDMHNQPVTEDISLKNGTAAAEQSKQDQQRRSIFVRSLPADTTSESLTDLFSESYPIKHATAVIDPATKQCKGYGFVTFADTEDAQRAKDEFNGRVLDGRKLRVEIAEPRHRDGDAPADGRAAQAATQGPQPTKLIVRNLPWSIKYPDQLSKLFISYGKVKQAYIPRKGPGLMAGFGFVVMRGRKNAEKAIEGVNGKEVDGRTLAVDWAVTKDVYEGAANGKTEQPDNSGELVKGYSDDDEDGQQDSTDDSGGESGGVDVHSDDSHGGDDDNDDDDDDDESGVEEESEQGENTNKRSHPTEDRSCTLFIRNLPFSCMDEDLEDHFSQFGSIRYARVVMDYNTERSKGTGFVCFYNRDDADECLRGAPRQSEGLTGPKVTNKDGKAAQPAHTVLQNDESDPSGNYTLDGRVLQVSRAVDKSEANRLTEEGTARRSRRDNDKRRLYLLSEGTISTKSKLWESLAPSEKAMREASVKQRKVLIESNPSLHLSLTRLSVRNIPRSVGSKELKALARDAIVGFASDVKAGRREKLSKEELSRGGEEMQTAELIRKRAGRGVVRQAKVVFEGANGSKVTEDSGAGRSRGYGFIEYHTHRNALMGLRWLNGHSVGYRPEDDENKGSRDDARDRKKRIIVEFAIENAQVVLRRREREEKARGKGEDGHASLDGGSRIRPKQRGDHNSDSRKRKREFDKPRAGKARTKDRGSLGTGDTAATPKKQVDEKVARRNQIIGRKRAMRRTRKGAKS